jgi:putative hydrolase of the HAD superfamily
MQASHFPVILLDALGTLVELQPPAPLLRAELAARFGAEVSEAEALEGIAAEIAYYRGHLDEGRDARSLAQLRARCAAALRRGLPARAAIDAIDTDSLLQALLASLRFEAFADVKPALAAARQRGQRLLVVSNWDVSLHGVLERLGITPLLDGVLTSAEAGARKPSPLIFERALGLVGGAAADAVHVGDSLEEDVAGARAAGIEPILVRRDGSPGPAGVRTISSLLELR